VNVELVHEIGAGDVCHVRHSNSGYAVRRRRLFCPVLSLPVFTASEFVGDSINHSSVCGIGVQSTFPEYLVLNSFAKGLGLDCVAVLNSCNQMTYITYIWRQFNCVMSFLENSWGLLGKSTVFLS
jgi:hypothetical protein